MATSRPTHSALLSQFNSESHLHAVFHWRAGQNTENILSQDLRFQTDEMFMVVVIEIEIKNLLLIANGHNQLWGWQNDGYYIEHKHRLHNNDNDDACSEFNTMQAQAQYSTMQ